MFFFQWSIHEGQGRSGQATLSNLQTATMKLCIWSHTSQFFWWRSVGVWLIIYYPCNNLFIPHHRLHLDPNLAGYAWGQHKVGSTLSIFLEASAILLFRVDKTWVVFSKVQVVMTVLPNLHNISKFLWDIDNSSEIWFCLEPSFKEYHVWRVYKVLWGWSLFLNIDVSTCLKTLSEKTTWKWTKRP